MTAERRVAPRHEVSRIGAISGDGMLKPIDCIIRDVSASGAMLVVKATEGIPRSFHLHIAGAAHTRRCEVKRRAAQTLGVRFTD